MPARRASPKAAKPAKRAPAAPAASGNARARLAREIRARFPDARGVEDWGLRGWRIPTHAGLTEWTGTIDPNFIHIFLVERKQGITLHFWNPLDPGALKRDSSALQKAGFKVMVGCLQFNRKGEFPLAAVLPLLEAARKAIAANGRG